MAAEAVLKIKEAEERGGELVRNASERAKEILRKAEADGAAKRKSIIDDAMRQRAGIISAAEKKAEADTSNLAAQGEDERKSILNPYGDKMNAAVKMVIERIVSSVGNS